MEGRKRELSCPSFVAAIEEKTKHWVSYPRQLNSIQSVVHYGGVTIL